MFCALSHQNRTECLGLERPIGKVLEQFPKVFLPQIWNSLSLEIKNSCSLNSLKNKLHVDKTNMYLQFECSKSNWINKCAILSSEPAIDSDWAK